MWLRNSNASKEVSQWGGGNKSRVGVHNVEACRDCKRKDTYCSIRQGLLRKTPCQCCQWSIWNSNWALSAWSFVCSSYKSVVLIEYLYLSGKLTLPFPTTLKEVSSYLAQHCAGPRGFFWIPPYALDRTVLRGQRYPRTSHSNWYEPGSQLKHKTKYQMRHCSPASKTAEESLVKNLHQTCG